MSRVLAFEAGPAMRAAVARSRTKARAAPRRSQMRTYLVNYTLLGGELEHWSFRLRRTRLTAKQLASQGALVGQISTPSAGKWSAYSPGALPRASEYAIRTIRDVTDELQEVKQ